MTDQCSYLLSHLIGLDLYFKGNIFAAAKMSAIREMMVIWISWPAVPMIRGSLLGVCLETMTGGLADT